MKLLLFLFAAFLCVCCQTPLPHFEVHHRGALRTLMHKGDLRATVALDTLQHLPHLYALGALENLKGEILIYDNKAFVSFVQDSAVTVSNNFTHKAALLVYAQITQWREIEIEEELANADALEAFVVQAAQQQGLNVAAPFPFLLTGTVAALDWHVINWAEGDTVHTHAKHKASGMHGRLEHAAVEILGFYSDRHQGVFTHHDSKLHLHAKTAAGDFAGHVDELQIRGAMRLLLPK